jgi:hypothetical protein
LDSRAAHQLSPWYCSARLCPGIARLGSTRGPCPTISMAAHCWLDAMSLLGQPRAVSRMYADGQEHVEHQPAPSGTGCSSCWHAGSSCHCSVYSVCMATTHQCFKKSFMQRRKAWLHVRRTFWKLIFVARQEDCAVLLLVSGLVRSASVPSSSCSILQLLMRSAMYIWRLCYRY